MGKFIENDQLAKDTLMALTYMYEDTRRVATPRKIVLILRKDMLGYKDLPFDWLVGEVKDRLEFLVNSGDVKKLAKGYRPVMDFDSK